MSQLEQTVVGGVSALHELTAGANAVGAPALSNVVGVVGTQAASTPAGTSALQTLQVVDRLQSYLVESSWSGSGTVQVQNSSGVSQLSMTGPGRYAVASLPTAVKFVITAGTPTNVNVKIIALHKGVGF
jgi:hypothetical protein